MADLENSNVSEQGAVTPAIENSAPLTQESAVPASTTVQNEKPSDAPTENTPQSKNTLDADKAAAAARRAAEAKYSTYKSTLELLAKREGYQTPEEYAEAVKKFVEEQELSAAVQKTASGKTTEDIARELEIERRKNAELSGQQEAAKRFASSLADFRKEYPEAEITPEMNDMFRNGYSHTDAYEKIQFRELKKQKAAEAVQTSNAQNAAASVGSLTGQQDTETAYTEEKIAAMSPKDMAKNLPEIMKFLRRK